ncbi:MAG: C40 family peptidase [Mobilitalea sp.]
MRGNKAMKTAVVLATAVLFLSIPATYARADDFISVGQGVAGIARSLENTTAKEIIEVLSISSSNMESKSPYKDLGVSVADNYVNVRKEPSLDSEVVGKLYRGCAADILERLEGDWVKIVSGDVEGYIASNFLAIGDAAEDMADEYATKTAIVIPQTLNVRETQSTDSKKLTLIPGGETYIVIKEYDEWVEILLGSDGETGKDYTGFVAKEWVELEIKFKYAISIKEENRIKQEQEDAERAEADRKTKLIEEEAERKEATRKAEEAKKEVKETKKETKKETPSVSVETNASGSALRNEVIKYAKKFVGNPYVWGGESLTRGADCSGFVRAIYAGFGYYIPRVSADQASSAGKQVNLMEIVPGDLIFYASGGRVNHVAMYIGDGKIVHAANSRQGIIISQYNYRDIYRVRRIIY